MRVGVKELRGRAIVLLTACGVAVGISAIGTFATGQFAVGTFAVVAQAAMEAPTGLQQKGASTTRVELAWNAFPGVNAYCIQYSKSETFENYMEGTVRLSVEGTADSLVSSHLPGLESGTTYYVRIALKGEDDAKGEFSQVLTVNTLPDAGLMGEVMQESATEDSISLMWQNVPGVTSYHVYDVTGGEVLFVGTTKENRITIGDQASATRRSFQVHPARDNLMGSDNYRSIEGASTLPQAPKGRVAVSGNIAGKRSSLQFGCAYLNEEDGYEVEVYKGKKLVDTVSDPVSKVNAKRDAVYRYRARTCVTVNGVKVYGQWTPYQKFVVQKLNMERVGRNLKVKWKKVKGVTGYDVSVSKYSEKQWKLFKRVGKKATSVLVKKYGKRPLKQSDDYYVLVTAYFGKKKNPTDVYVSFVNERDN